MKIHHLNCGTHCPVGGALFDGTSLSPLARITTHVLLIETGDGLVLVDTGYGLQDVRHPHPRISKFMRGLLNIRLHEDDTALRQIERLGFSAKDVRHIVLTHLDFDHAGGIEDFPQARVHVMESEKHAAETKRRGFFPSRRYRPLQWDDVREWRTYARGGEDWFGFEAVRDLDGLPQEILMIPLPGHTLGHAGIAVKTAEGWLLHAGDAYFNRGEVSACRCCPPGMTIYQMVMAADRPARLQNRGRLRDLNIRSGSDVRIFCSHDVGELDALRGASGARLSPLLQ
jgi:glyoxylase-like metal-dependent hydrolase (beta-lactamase superfamily II)